MPSQAQTPSQSHLDVLLPVVPSLPMRPLSSPGNNFSVEPRSPITSLIEGVTASDATLEIKLGSARMITTRQAIANEGGVALLAVGDPTVIDFELVGPRLVRVVSKRVGMSDLTITTDEGESYSFEVNVTYDLDLIQIQLQEIYPDAAIHISQLRDHVVLRGEARSPFQVQQIVSTLQLFLSSYQATTKVTGTQVATPGTDPAGAPAPGQGGEGGGRLPTAGPASPQTPDSSPQTTAEYPAAQIINLLRVPGVQQVQLHVKVAELNRTALRRVGADLFYRDGSGNTLGTQIGGQSASLFGLGLSQNSNGFAVFPSARLDVFFSALRQNSIINVLAEPNLVAIHGQEASFLAGGQFPVPIPQPGGGAGANVIAIQFQEFGVRLNFTPYILEDETIRLRVAPEVSSIDQGVGVTVLGTTVPGLATRRVESTVQMRQGETLALAGLLQIQLDATTTRIPGLGDLPYLGPFFSNTTHQKVEKELLILVTPFLVSPMSADEVPCAPGEDIMDPNDLEFYTLSRIEGRTGRPHRPTTNWDDPIGVNQLLKLERRHVQGAVGYSN